MIEIFTKIERAMVGVLVCKKSPEPLLIIILCSKDNKYSTKLCINYTFECQVGCLVLLIVFPIGKSPIRKRFLHHSHEPTPLYETEQILATSLRCFYLNLLSLLKDFNNKLQK
jgi:hypothetical protein